MNIIRTAEAFARLLATHPDPDLKALLQAQADRLAEYDDYTLEELAMIAVIQPHDTLEGIDTALGWTLLDGDIFAKPVELIDLRSGWYEVTFILGDDGFGLVLYVPDTKGTNEQLLRACDRECAR